MVPRRTKKLMELSTYWDAASVTPWRALNAYLGARGVEQTKSMRKGTQNCQKKNRTDEPKLAAIVHRARELQHLCAFIDRVGHMRGHGRSAADDEDRVRGTRRRGREKSRQKWDQPDSKGQHFPCSGRQVLVAEFLRNGLRNKKKQHVNTPEREKGTAAAGGGGGVDAAREEKRG